MNLRHVINDFDMPEDVLAIMQVACENGDSITLVNVVRKMHMAMIVGERIYWRSIDTKDYSVTPPIPEVSTNTWNLSALWVPESDTSYVVRSGSVRPLLLPEPVTPDGGKWKLDAVSKIVGGYVAHHRIAKGWFMLADEDAKMKQNPHINFLATLIFGMRPDLHAGDYIVGDVVLAAPKHSTLLG